MWFVSCGDFSVFEFAVFNKVRNLHVKTSQDQTKHLRVCPPTGVLSQSVFGTDVVRLKKNNLVSVSLVSLCNGTGSFSH